MKKATANNQSAAWYVLRTYPGVEGKVKRSLENRLRAKKQIPGEYQIVIPVDEDDEAVFSGFVLLRIQIKNDIWTLARNTPGVTGFVGIGNTPTPFYAEDWEAIPLYRYVN